MYTSTDVWFEWTGLAESRWSWHNKEPRKAGTTVMTKCNGEWVKRKTVPTNWIRAGYVVESDGVQIDLFECL